MKSRILTILILLAFNISFSQTSDSIKTKSDSVSSIQQQPKTKKDTRPMKERIDFGFGTSFWITPSQTFIEVTPVLAYRFPKTLITGLGYRYIYRHDRVFDRDLNAYGPNVFARVNLIPKIYLWTQYEILNNEYLTPNPNNVSDASKSTISTNSWFAGLGFMKSVGRKGKGGISMQILYNFLYDKDDDLYYSPVTYQVGYFF